MQDLKDAPSQDIRAQLQRTFLFMEKAHEGTDRMRPNGDGTPRSYDHHPMEVALLFAEMEIFYRRADSAGADPEHVADKIINVLKIASEMNKAQLKTRLHKIARRLDKKQFTTMLGFLCHDTIESSYSRDMNNAYKNKMSRLRRKQIHSIDAETERVVVRLTDSRKLPDKEAKKARQMELARSKGYAELKQYDILANMYDEPLIPHTKRTPSQKRDAMNHMHKFMCVAHSRGHIPRASLIAAQRMYAQSMQRLANG